MRFQKIVCFGSLAFSHFKQLCLSKNTCSTLKLSGPAMSCSTCKMSKNALRSRGLKSTCDHVLFGDGTMCAHGQASRDVTKTSPMIPGVLNLKNRISSLTEKETPKSSLCLPESRNAFWTLASSGPVTPP